MTDKTDLHLHTYYSDGSLSPAELVAWAKSRELETIAVTDHDGVEGILEALAAGETLGVTVIPGIELSAQTEEGVGVHILGYDIDPQNRALAGACKKMRSARRRRNERLMEALRHMGYQLKWEDLSPLPDKDYVGKPHFASALARKGYIKTPRDAFAQNGIFMDRNIRKLKKEKVGAAEAIKLILGAGGTAVLAHPMKIRHLGERGSEEFFQALEDLLSRLSALGLSGLECVYPEHTDEEIMRLMVLAHKLGLRVTGGSDYHGPDFEPGFID